MGKQRKKKSICILFAYPEVMDTCEAFKWVTELNNGLKQEIHYGEGKYIK
jgi:hypothetical protein